MKINKPSRLSLILVCAIFLFSNSCAKAQDASAQTTLAQDASVDGARTTLVQLAEFSKKQTLQSEAAQKLLSGEMLDLKIDSFGKLTDLPDKVLLLEKNNAVGRFQWFGENDQITDVYFYLEFNKGWTVHAVRLLSLTGIIEEAYLGLKAKPNLTTEEKSELTNMKLTLSPDKELIIWMKENREKFDALSALLQAKSNKTTVYVKRDDKQFPEAAELLRKLNLRTASVNPNGNIEFVIGGITDNTVGFIYSPSKNPPKISPAPYIWVEEIVTNWYLFRTT